VPAVTVDKGPRKAAAITVLKRERLLQVEDREGHVLAQFPVSLGGRRDPLTTGKWKITNEVKDPVVLLQPGLDLGREIALSENADCARTEQSARRDVARAFEASRWHPRYA
jgi:hypothetical protein